MKGVDFVKHLRKAFKAKTDVALSKSLGVTQPAINQWRKRKLISDATLIGQIKRLATDRIDGIAIVDALQKKFKAKSLSSLALQFGVTVPA